MKDENARLERARAAREHASGLYLADARSPIVAAFVEGALWASSEPDLPPAVRAAALVSAHARIARWAYTGGPKQNDERKLKLVCAADESEHRLSVAIICAARNPERAKGGAE